MRKWKVFLSLLFIFIFINSLAFAAAYPLKYFDVKVDGKNLRVREVPIIMDGKEIHLDAPSYITPAGVTFVPVRFITEHYGAKVEWIDSTKTAVISTSNGTEIKLTINSQNVYINGKKQVIAAEWVPKLVTLKAGEYPRTMVPLRFVSEVLGYEVGYNGERGVPFINSPKNNGDDKGDNNDGTGGDGNTATNKVKEVKKEIVDGKQAIVIYKTDNVEVKSLKLTNPVRLVYDLTNSTLANGSYFNYDFSIGPVKGVRVSQFSPDVVRVVLDIKDGITSPEVKIVESKDKLVIIPISKLNEVIQYTNNGSNKLITINTGEKDDYDVDYDEKTKTMTVEVYSRDLDLEEGSMDIYDGLVNTITVKKEKGVYKFVITFLRNIEYDILNSKDKEIKLSIRKSQNVKPSDFVIVVDAGHGGHDPGATQNGVKEKDINLQVAIKLNNALKEAGYNTIMTRDTDEFVQLKDRAGIANNNNVDIFISLHCNSASAASATGIEVLYCPPEGSSLKKGDDYPLAQLLMDELAKGTGAVKRGVKKRPELAVLNGTSMPAALIEMGFITNSQEAKNLQSDSYQNKIVESIVRAVNIYFQTYY